MSTRHFTLTLAATVHLDDKVIDRVVNNEDDWQGTYYNLPDVEAVAEHVGLGIIHGARLSQLDGFADLPDELAGVDGPAVEFCIEDAPEESA